VCPLRACKLSIIIPSYNEATLPSVLKRLTALAFPCEYEIIIVDDGSMPEVSLISDTSPQIQILRNLLNSGKGNAVRKGIEAATGTHIIVQDADEEYHPEDILSLIKLSLEKKIDVVYGSRFLDRTYPSGMALPNWIANKFLTGMTNFLFGTRLTDMETCYKLFRSDLLKSLQLKADRFDFEPEVTVLTTFKKIKIHEVPITYKGRNQHKGKKIKPADFFQAFFVLLKYRLIRDRDHR
jgi:glycosyltransferase involved in cell wall biosynthesis